MTNDSGELAPEVVLWFAGLSLARDEEVWYAMHEAAGVESAIQNSSATRARLVRRVVGPT